MSLLELELHRLDIDELRLHSPSRFNIGHVCGCSMHSFKTDSRRCGIVTNFFFFINKEKEKKEEEKVFDFKTNREESTLKTCDARRQQMRCCKQVGTHCSTLVVGFPPLEPHSFFPAAHLVAELQNF